MSILSEISQKCGERVLETGRLPVAVKLPFSKYDQLCEEMKPTMRMPMPEQIYGELPGGGYGWRSETPEEYSLRVNEKPRIVKFYLTTGVVDIIPYVGDAIEVLLEEVN